jgi:hypothetical protein
MPHLRLPFPPRKVRAPDILPLVKEYVRRRQAAIGVTAFCYKKERIIGRSRADFDSRIGTRWEGFEIKSETDSLSRLRTQVGDYNYHFDRCWIVAHSKHFPFVMNRVPEWWGVMEVWAEGGDVVMKLRRPPKDNPEVRVDKLLNLLWKTELIELARRKGIKAKSRWGKYFILLEISKTFTVLEARLTVHEFLKRRGSM